MTHTRSSSTQAAAVACKLHRQPGSMCVCGMPLLSPPQQRRCHALHCCEALVPEVLLRAPVLQAEAVKARLQEVEELQADRERTRAALAAARDRLQVRWSPAHAHTRSSRAMAATLTTQPWW